MTDTPRKSAQASGTDSYVLFELAGATYALLSDDIQQLEMVGQPPPTPVPNAPSYVEGVVAVRGQVIPAVNLRARFGFPATPHDVRSRLLVIRAEGRTVGLIVDSAREFACIPPEAVLPLPDGLASLSGRYLRGIAHRGDRVMLVVDIRELLEIDANPIDPAPTETAMEPALLGAPL